MRDLAVAAAAIILASCASAPSSRAVAVKEADDRGVASCTFVGTVQGGSLLGGAMGDVSVRNAMVDAREQAAALGATHIVYSSIEHGGMYSTGSATARAYRCPG